MHTTTTLLSLFLSPAALASSFNTITTPGPLQTPQSIGGCTLISPSILPLGDGTCAHFTLTTTVAHTVDCGACEAVSVRYEGGLGLVSVSSFSFFIVVMDDYASLFLFRLGCLRWMCVM